MINIHEKRNNKEQLLRSFFPCRFSFPPNIVSTSQEAKYKYSNSNIPNVKHFSLLESPSVMKEMENVFPQFKHVVLNWKIFFHVLLCSDISMN